MNFFNPSKWVATLRGAKGPLSWDQLSTLGVGTKVRFTMKTVFPMISACESAEGVIEENLINENVSMIFVKVTSPSDVVSMLVHWNGCVKAYAPDQAARSALSPFSLVEG